jgi:soluble lytic murein transglycosylase-like protein
MRMYVMIGLVLYGQFNDDTKDRRIKELEETVDFLTDASNLKQDEHYDQYIERKVIKVAKSTVSTTDLEEITAAVYKYAAEYQVPENMVVSIFAQESNFNRFAVSTAGAVGIGQMMPSTAKEVAGELGVAEYDLTDIQTNVRFSVYYMAKMLKMFGGNQGLAIKAYNSGAGRVRRVLRGLAEYPGETVDYHVKVTSFASVLNN